MQERSVVYHVLDGQLQGGPSWDPNQPDPQLDPNPDSGVVHEWVIWNEVTVPWFPSATARLDWWETWLDDYPAFAESIRGTGPVMEGYWNASQDAYAYIQGASSMFAREEARWPCRDIASGLASRYEWMEARSSWLISNIASFSEDNVTYKASPWRMYFYLTVVPAFALVAMALVATLYRCAGTEAAPVHRYGVGSGVSSDYRRLLKPWRF